MPRSKLFRASSAARSRAWFAGLLALAYAVIACQPVTGGEIQQGYLSANKAFRAAAKQVAPSLVTIETYGGLARQKKKRGQSSGLSRPGDGPTTGLIVSSDGYIVTSTYNFLRKPSLITVVLPDGTQHVAKQLGSDETRKICVLKVEGVSGLPVAPNAPTSELRVGQWAISVGIGFGGDEPAISSGILSALDRVSGKAVQTDANISPANYGGPLVDIEGRVIGVCVPLSPMASDVAAGSEWYDSGIGFAVPLHDAEALIAQLKEGKTIRPGKLGIQPKATTAEGAGVTLVGVAPDSPAAKAGLKADDQVLRVGEREVLDTPHLRALLGRYAAGEKVSLTVQRGDEQLTLEAELVEGVDAPMPMLPMLPLGPQEKPADPQSPAQPAPEQSPPDE